MEDNVYEFAKSIAKEAGQLLLEGLNKRMEISRKSGPTDLVTQFDHASQELIASRIREQYPGHSILAEEELTENNGSTQWIVDPIDGTNNYVYGYPLFSVSIAIEDQDEMKIGVVHTPILNETFSACKGQGAWLNGDQISVTQTENFKNSLLATGFPYDEKLVPEAIDLFSKLARKTLGIRRGGSAALDLSFLAAGRLDGFWELDLEPWDIAAGSLIVKEAGGKISDFQGNEHNIYKSRGIVASNAKIHGELISRLS